MTPSCLLRVLLSSSGTSDIMLLFLSWHSLYSCLGCWAWDGKKDHPHHLRLSIQMPDTCRIAFEMPACIHCLRSDYNSCLPLWYLSAQRCLFLCLPSQFVQFRPVVAYPGLLLTYSYWWPWSSITPSCLLTVLSSSNYVITVHRDYCHSFIPAFPPAQVVLVLEQLEKPHSPSPVIQVSLGWTEYSVKF